MIIVVGLIGFDTVRHEVLGTAFSTAVEDGHVAFIYLLGVQQPQETWFLQAHFCMDAVPRLDLMTEQEAEAAMAQWHLHRLEPTRHYQSHAELPFDGSGDIVVIEGLSFTENGYLISDVPARPLADWEAEFAPLAVEGTPRQVATRVSISARDRLMLEHPWLREHFESSSTGSSTTVQRRPTFSVMDMEDTSTAIHDQVSSEELDPMEDWQGPTSSQRDFFTRARYRQRDDVMITTFGAEACRGIVREWCVKYGMQQSPSLSANIYGPETASIICEEWCRRHQHLFDIWAKAGSDFEYRFSDRDSQSYVAPVVWLELCARLPVGSPAYLRCQAIDTIAPRNP